MWGLSSFFRPVCQGHDSANSVVACSSYVVSKPQAAGISTHVLKPAHYARLLEPYSIWRISSACVITSSLHLNLVLNVSLHVLLMGTQFLVINI